jgi:ketosteroid isomerase-like protein
MSRHRDEAKRAMGKIASLEANRAESAAVLDVLNRFAAAWNAKDFKQIASIQHDLDIRQLKTQLAPVKSVVMKISPVMEPQIDGKQATVVCRRQASETFSDGSTRQNPASIVTYVLTKQGAVWSIEHAH